MGKRRDYSKGWKADCGHSLDEYTADGRCPECGKPRVFTPVGSNRSGMVQLMGGIHVATPVSDVVRQITKKVLRNAMPAAVKAGVIKCALECHKVNRDEYRAVMGHSPMPDQELITRVMMGELDPSELLGEVGRK